MKRILLIAFVILPIALFVPQAFGGTEVNIKSATVNLDTLTLTLKGVNFDVNGGVLTVILNGNLLGCTVVNPEEVTCNISGETLEPGTTYTVSVAAGNAPGRNDEIDVYISDGSSGGCTNGAFTSCYNGPAGTMGIGECQSGTSTCADSTWGSCVGEKPPEAEICGDDKDNDCDGIIDNGCDECQVDTDCTGGSPPTCDQPWTCQGIREDGVCAASTPGGPKTCSYLTVDDDSACDSTIKVFCGLFVDAYCNGSESQHELGPCKISCETDSDCKTYAYCDRSVALDCLEKKMNGEPCSASNECLSGHCNIWCTSY